MKLRYITTLLLVGPLLGLLLAGCAELEQLARSTGVKPPVEGGKTPAQGNKPKTSKGEAVSFPAGDIDQIMAYFHYVQGLSTAEQKREFAQLKTNFEKHGDNFDRFRLVFLSVLPGKPFSDRDYALKLLQGSLHGEVAADEGLKGLAVLLTLLIGQQQDLQHALTVEKDRAETLARQLKELKDIEKILSEREKQRPPGK